MPRKSRANKGSQQSGYKFDCQYCEETDVVQGPPPELCFLLERDRGVTISSSYQSCVECAQEIRELTAKYNKKFNPPVTQVRPLRPDSELPPDVQAAKAEIAKAKEADAKLDKVVNAVAGLTELMTQFMTMQIQKEMVASGATKEKHAESAPEKPKTKTVSKAKPKSSGTGKPKPRSKGAR